MKELIIPAETNYDISKQLPRLFEDTLVFLMDYFSITEEDLSEKSRISVRTISRYRTYGTKCKMKLETVLKLIIGLKLPIPFREVLLEQAGFKLNNTIEHYHYRYILYNNYEDGIDACNKYLIDNNINPL